MMERNDYLRTIEGAILAGRPDFAKRLIGDWKEFWPGDLKAQLLQARAEIAMLAYKDAVESLRAIISVDPEHADAYALLAESFRATEQPQKAIIAEACKRSLRGEDLNSEVHPSWSLHMKNAIDTLLKDGDHQYAVAEALEALTADPNLALPTLIALKAQLQNGNRASAVALAHAGHDRWSECAAFLLVIADELMREGRSSRAVENIHKAASYDLSGRIAVDILGDDHPYSSLWSDDHAAPISRALPAKVAAYLGGNRLEQNAGGEAAHLQDPTEKTDDVGLEIHTSQKGDMNPALPAMESGEELPLPEPEPWEAFKGPDPGDLSFPPDSVSDENVLLEVQEEFILLADRLNSRRRNRDEDGRSPAYIVLTSRTRVTQVLGEDQFERVDDAVISLVESVRRRPGWTAYRFYIDDPQTLSPFELAPVDPSNAWQIKLRLADLDQALAKRGEMIGALFIIGGHNIIPFHQLPNPTDDDDDFVASDNPYATSDENYFAPEWPVGRLPIESDTDSLVRYLHQSVAAHSRTVKIDSMFARFRVWFATRFGGLMRGQHHSMGYTASIWRKASVAVFKTIGEPGKMITSPPTEASRLPAYAYRPVSLSYYNLHGLEDAPEWYGQRDPMRDEDLTSEFPIALRPEDVVNSGRAPKIVFSEACYGANSLGKSSDEALCLKFLDAGSRAVIGSTKISYGSVTPPLIAADLLGRYFWVGINEMLSTGEALRRAKLRLANEMHKRQGYLDGEDQKTVISFVLYGDPLYVPLKAFTYPGEKAVIRRKARPTQMKTACALGGPEISREDLPKDMSRKIDLIVSQYLPGMTDAVCKIHNQGCYCDGKDHVCPTHQMNSKQLHGGQQGSTVITLSKSITVGSRVHPHFARLTFDRNGKVMKLAVSR